MEKVHMMIVTDAYTYHAVIGRTCPAAPRDTSNCTHAECPSGFMLMTLYMRFFSQKSGPTSTSSLS